THQLDSTPVLELLPSLEWLVFFLLEGVAGTSLYELSMQGYLTVESLWKKNTKREHAVPILHDNQAEDVQQAAPNNSS
ncbi:hypothetical protein scyTo_0021066, partial [Scyliorhinus torazame]|nr:hypothetical protein [Scyliorhinus torazame]